MKKKMGVVHRDKKELAKNSIRVMLKYFSKEELHKLVDETYG